MFPIAVEIPLEGLVTAGSVFAALLYGVVKFFLDHRELKKTAAKGSRPEAKPRSITADSELVVELRGQIESLKKELSWREVVVAKDAKIEELSKALSKKSDDFAIKVQELLQLTLKKAEQAGDKNVDLVERMMEKVSDFTTEVRTLSAELSELSHRQPPREG